MHGIDLALSWADQSVLCSSLSRHQLQPLPGNVKIIEFANLQVVLEAGPAALLAVAEPQPLRTGLRAVLPLLRVHTTDAHGNAAMCPNCEARLPGV